MKRELPWRNCSGENPNFHVALPENTFSTSRVPLRWNITSMAYARRGCRSNLDVKGSVFLQVVLVVISEQLFLTELDRYHPGQNYRIATEILHNRNRPWMNEYILKYKKSGAIADSAFGNYFDCVSTLRVINPPRTKAPRLSLELVHNILAFILESFNTSYCNGATR